MAIQIKYVDAETRDEAEAKANLELMRLGESFKDIKFLASGSVIAIIYENAPQCGKHLCCDCAHFDDSHNHSGLIGLCQVTGKRVRFSDKSCEKYLDRRD